jgi:hypothetical protein
MNERTSVCLTIHIGVKEKIVFHACLRSQSAHGWAPTQPIIIKAGVSPGLPRIFPRHLIGRPLCDSQVKLLTLLGGC